MTDERIGSRRLFDRLPGGGYALSLVDDGVRVEVRHLRREHHQLIGEVDVLCEWYGAQTYNGSLASADLNLSSQAARVARGEHCAERAKSKPADFDWIGVLDEACRRVIHAEREGAEPIVLDDAVQIHHPDLDVCGLSFPADGPSGVIADGDGLKSLVCLLVLGTLAQAGQPTLYLDWEWTAARHLARKHRLFGHDRLERLHYLKCTAPLPLELDRIRRFCDQHQIRYLAIDSAALAADGKLSDDDTAQRLHRALADLPPSLCAFHIPKSSISADPKTDARPFGSAFFHNFARVTWLLKKQASPSDDVVTVGAFPQKQNDGSRYRPVGLEFAFTPERIAVRHVDLARVEGLAEALPVWQRLKSALTHGPRTLASLAEELHANVETLDRTVRRKHGLFTRVSGTDGITRIALLERGAA